MIINISDEPITVIENGIYRFQLINYPHIEEYELDKIITFIWYEKSHGRQTEIICKDKSIISIVNNAVVNLDCIEKILMETLMREFVFILGTRIFYDIRNTFLTVIML